MNNIIQYVHINVSRQQFTRREHAVQAGGQCTSLTGRQRSTGPRQTRRPGKAHFPTSTPQQERCIRHHTRHHAQRTHSLRPIIAPFGAPHPPTQYRPSTLLMCTRTPQPPAGNFKTYIPKIRYLKSLLSFDPYRVQAHVRGPIATSPSIKP